jgi:hypothetical protein
MSTLFGLNPLYLLTAGLVVALAVPIWACYRYDIYDPTADNAATTSSVFIKADARLASFIQAWNIGLGYFFVGYSWVVKTYYAYNKTKYDMYRWLVLVLSLVAWGFTLARPIGGPNNTASPEAGAINAAGGAANDQLDSVAKNVFGPIAASSLFALPMLFIVP